MFVIQNDRPVRDLVENAGLDAWIQGPTWDTPLQVQQLLQVLAQMQAQRRRAAAVSPKLATAMGSGLYNGSQSGAAPAGTQVRCLCTR